MPTTSVNGVDLYYALEGSGPSLVLVHGSWGDGDNWARVVPSMATRCTVVTYDRRGHSRSERPTRPDMVHDDDTVHDDVADLAALIERLDLAPAFVCGTSYGALITLRLALSHPRLVRGVAVHEPPAVPLLAGVPAAEAVAHDYMQRIAPVRALLEAGKHRAAAERFVETIAFGPGQWAHLPEAVHRTFERNAPTYLDELNDPDALVIDLASLRQCPVPLLLTQGDQSPPMFAPIVERIASGVPDAERHVYTGAGHVPHLTHPDDFVRITTDRAVGVSGPTAS
jgi:pimeloyl-ACP methyl ester carboxylesterase